MRRARFAIVAAVLALLTACGSDGSDPDERTTSSPAFADGTTMAQLAASGTIRIGVKTDSPGLGYLPPDAPAGSAPEGFDVEIGKIIAKDLKIDEDSIQWVPVHTSDRESALTSGKADLVIATFSMTSDRAAVVGQAGPYYVTGQQILVHESSDITGLDDLEGKTVCSVAGSESDPPLVEAGAITKAYTSYSACVDDLVDGDLDAISTDSTILAGFLEQHPDDLAIVGTPFNTQRYGIGYPHGDAAFCQFLNEALLDAYADGSWKAAFESTLGNGVVEAPRAPRPDACPQA